MALGQGLQALECHVGRQTGTLSGRLPGEVDDHIRFIDRSNPSDPSGGVLEYERSLVECDVCFKILNRQEHVPGDHAYEGGGFKTAFQAGVVLIFFSIALDQLIAGDRILPVQHKDLLLDFDHLINILFIRFGSIP